MKEGERIKQTTSFGTPIKDQPSVSCDKAIILKDGSEKLSISLLNSTYSRTETYKSLNTFIFILKFNPFKKFRSKDESLLSNYKNPLEYKTHHSNPALNDIIRSGSSLDVEVFIPSLANRKNPDNVKNLSSLKILIYFSSYLIFSRKK